MDAKSKRRAMKVDNRQWTKGKKLKDILDAAIVSTPEVFTDYSPNVPMTSTPVKKPSARKSLCLFTNILDVK